MMIVADSPGAALDESAREFISTFVANVARVAGDADTSFATVARIERLLVGAIAEGAGGSECAWGALYRTVDAVVAGGRDTDDARRAHAYLRAFMRENADLADV